MAIAFTHTLTSDLSITLTVGDDPVYIKVEGVVASVQASVKDVSGSASSNLLYTLDSTEYAEGKDFTDCTWTEFPVGGVVVDPTITDTLFDSIPAPNILYFEVTAGTMRLALRGNRS